MESIFESKKQQSQTNSDSVTAIQQSFRDNQIQQLIHRLEQQNSQIQWLNNQIQQTNSKLQRLKQQKQQQTEASEEETSKLKLRHAILNSSVHGLPHIFRTKRTSFKIIWFILLISSCCGCSYYVFDTISDYFNHDIITKIISTTEKHTEFPTVSICNTFSKTFELKPIYIKYGLEDLRSTWKNHFEIYNDTGYGQCYRFNSGKNYTGHNIPIKIQASSGYYYGLDLILYVDSNQDYNRLKLFIHNRTTLLSSVENKGSFLVSGSVNYFPVQRVFTKILSEPFNDCYENVTTFSFNKTLIDFIQAKRKYSQDECIKLCQNLLYQEKTDCLCKLTTLEDNLVKQCAKSKIDANCTSQYIDLFQMNYAEVICSKYCPLECEMNQLVISQHGEIITAKGKINDSFNHPLFRTYENVLRTGFTFTISRKSQDNSNKSTS
jgi:hypothetical protein